MGADAGKKWCPLGIRTGRWFDLDRDLGVSACMNECVYTHKSPWERARPVSQKCLHQERWVGVPLDRSQSLVGEVWRNTPGSLTEKRHLGCSPEWLLSVRRTWPQEKAARPSLSLLERALLGWGAEAPPARLLSALSRVSLSSVWCSSSLWPFSPGSPPSTPLRSPRLVFCRPPLPHLSSVTRWPLPEAASVPVASHRLGWHVASSQTPKNLATPLGWSNFLEDGQLPVHPGNPS